MGENRIGMDVRVQPLHDITEEDAQREGISRGPDGWWNGTKHAVKGTPKAEPTARAAFESLWDTINGERATWRINPWVWVIDFDLLTRTRGVLESMPPRFPANRP